MRSFTTGRDDAAAPALVLVHGLGHWTQGAWNRLVVQFAATHRIVAFDLPGFGASDKPDVSYRLSYFTSVLRAVVAAAELRNFGLVGHSFGGLIAAQYAAYHPDRVRLLGLIAPAGFLRTPHLAARIVASRLALGLRLRAAAPAAFVRWSIRRAVWDPAAIVPDDVAHAEALGRDPAVTRTFLRIYASAGEDLVRMRALQRRMAAYEGPAVLIWGARDRYIPARALSAARRVYPQAEVLLLQYCGHCPALEDPRAVAELLRANGL